MYPKIGTGIFDCKLHFKNGILEKEEWFEK